MYFGESLVASYTVKVKQERSSELLVRIHETTPVTTLTTVYFTVMSVLYT
jgi:hypothetical protein